jgi:hypothetical protein
MRRIVEACAGHVSTRKNSVCKELELAGAIEKLVLMVAVSVLTAAGLAAAPFLAAAVI